MPYKVQLADLEIVEVAARQISHKIPRFIERDDMRSAGNEALVKMAKTFRGNRRAEFRGKARRRVYGAMQDELRRMDTVPRETRRKIRNGLANDCVIPRLVPLERAVNASNPMANSEEQVINASLVGEMKSALHILAEIRPKLGTVLRMHYFEGHEVGHIARELKTSSIYVCQLRDTAIEMLRAIMGKSFLEVVES